ncbi:bifunctional methylenetetrahydrofolate dehydrogenase/methenyltetrahydrofolate cyclohydrolase [Streptococcus sp. sy010]|uniref:bifunctional methylenetetrahydrofolate dehydrogenase/methenyltetrahydrofolate cyclohydrolase n=1 Tax=Streptococcus sp. sy010 TaxID=2600148 RepID=UPI0011B485C6|nr:bifunctional methylenetetrahydrofolate dehydrogenase/methenyltetrahydrofolate cyclohydrolase [Streptococcus sp. sy010]TWT16569.1 bifunctional methylenetetrahydrofolate dehydrogenase/methenyltetrahydrofolate cyclohydrolase [Streptococcus sp. sy010]
MARLIDGKAVAQQMQAELAEKVAKLKSETGIVPKLVVILVGDDPASQLYVGNKERAALKAGFESEIVRVPETISQSDLLDLIENYNQDRTCHGILVQLPLPNHINDQDVLLAISPDKDVDGFHPMNMGQLWSGHGSLIPCTPAGIIKLLDTYKVELEGKQALVIGRSNIVGKPMAQLLLDRNATVTIAHSRTKNLAELARQADILIVAIGRGHFVTKEFVKEGAVVIDVGMNRLADGRFVGDVKFDEVSEVASLITPVPGGVGPMTITMLLEQTYQIAKNKGLS